MYTNIHVCIYVYRHRHRIRRARSSLQAGPAGRGLRHEAPPELQQLLPRSQNINISYINKYIDIYIYRYIYIEMFMYYYYYYYYCYYYY